MMKNVRGKLRGGFCRKVIACVLVWALVMNTLVSTVMALGPEDVIGTLDQNLTPGAGVVLPSGSWGTHPIIDTEHGAIIDWSNFNTSAGETVEFRQYDVLGGTLSENSAVLNRITSGSVPTTFGGALLGNGCVFVVNPAGVIFNSGSTVNVSQLVVSGLGMTNEAFHDAVLNGNPMVFNGGNGNVENRAMINANRVYLVGKKIRNISTISAPNGLIVLAAGDSVYLAQDGSEVVVEILEDPLDATPDIDNRSLIAANDGSIVLAAGDTFSRAIRNVGFIVSGGGSVTARAARVINERSISVSSTTGDAGSITLAGSEEVQFGPYGSAHSTTAADGGDNGNGGNITIETEGTITLPEGESLSARGGSNSGNGGSIKLTCEHFVIEGDIDASPQNTSYENGTLEIDPSAVAVEDGANAGAQDTIYTDDIETLSNTGTNLIVRANEITVRDLVDGIIGSRGDIEFDGTGPDGTVTFEDPSDTISTIQGDIRMSAGSGGIVAGNLETGRYYSEPGRIVLETENGGPITVNNLTIRKGLGTAEIDVDASGSLTVNGDVVVGRDSEVRNTTPGEKTVARVSLKSGDEMVLNGSVTARAYSMNPGDSEAHISILAGSNKSEAGDLTINQDLVATAESSDGASDALVEVDTWGNINWGPNAEATADGDSGEVHVGPPDTSGRESALDTDDDGELGEDNDGDRAQIIIDARNYLPYLDGVPDFAETHMGRAVTIDVLANDMEATNAALEAGPAHGDVVQNPDGTFTYTPDAGYVGDDSFTYTAGNASETTDPITVTITLTNDMPQAMNDKVVAMAGYPVGGNVLANDFDTDGDPLTVALGGTAPANGSVTLNPDGTFTYTSNPGFVGEDAFTYEVSDGQVGAGTSTATVMIYVESNLVPMLSPVAPGLERKEVKYSGCPALAKWVAKELGVDESKIEIWMTNSLASSRDIQPYETYARLRMAAIILKDSRGDRITALDQVINEFASSTAPLSDEQMSSIADAIMHNADNNNDYGLADEYLNALAMYIGILNSEMGFSMDDVVKIVMKNYIQQMTERRKVNVAAYLTARLAKL